MKRIFKLLIFAGLACFAAAACIKEEPTPAALTAPTLSVSPSSVVVAEESQDIALTFSWNDVSAEGITPVYGFQVTKKGDNDFASGTAFECTTTEKKFSHAELAALAGEIGASLNDGFSLIARVRVTAKESGIEPVLSNVVEVAVGKEQYAIANLYPIGNGTPYGWSQDKTVAMEKSGSTFTWTGHLYGNAEFKFLLQNDGNWWPGIVNKTDDPFKYEPVIGFSDAEDKKFKVDKEGKYTITIDASNTNALKMDVKFIDDDIQQLVVEHLYILGGATKTGWSLDDMEEFEKNGNIFTWEGSLTEGGEFRFPMQRDWWPCLMIAMDGETLVKGVSDDEKTGYAVDETAIYKIVCDIDNMKVSITKTGDVAPAEFPTLFMCGSATPYGWTTAMTDENQLKPLDASNKNVLGWTGELKADGTFKFLTTSDWIPSYNRDASAAEYWTLTYRENYDQPDEQFAVSEDGTYKVVVDLDAMKVTCTKDGAADTFDYTPSAAYNASNNLWKNTAAGNENFYYYSCTGADWNGSDTITPEPPFMTKKESTYKLTYESFTNDRWQNQFFITTQDGHHIALDPAKTYKFSVTVQSTASFGAFFKLEQYDPAHAKHEGAAIWEPEGYPNNINLTAGTPVTLEHEFTGVEAPSVNLVFDFGGNPDGAVVYIKDIVLVEQGAPAGQVLFLNEFETEHKKIEIYNASDSEIDMTGWTLSKDETVWTIPAEHAKVPAKGYIVYTGKSDGTLDPTFGLSGTKGFIVVLKDKDGNEIDKVDNSSAREGGIVTIDDGKSWGRETDGAANFVLFDTPTIGGANGSAAQGSVNMVMDGDMSDWASISGTVLEPTGEEGVEGAQAIAELKGYADADYIYVYVKRVKLGRWTALWGGDDKNAGYYYYDFDLDNNPETGDYAENSHGNFEAWTYLYLFGGTAEAPTFRVTPPGNPKGMSIDRVRCYGCVTADAIEVEIAFPRADLPSPSSDIISVSVWGNKDGNPMTKVSFPIK